MRRIRGEQDIITRYEPERALATLPQLVRNKADRVKLLTVFDRMLSDKRIHEAVSQEERAILKKIGKTLAVDPKEMPLLASVEATQ